MSHILAVGVEPTDDEEHPRKTLAKVPAHIARRILARMKKIASDPYAPDNNAESMRGMDGYIRLRSGDWRVFYKVETDVLHRMSALSKREALRILVKAGRIDAVP